jgi:alpha-mannosidase
MKTKLFAISVIIALSCVASAQTPSWFTGGRLYLVNSSHQDIAWMDSPEECIRFRDEQMLTPALKRLAESPTYCFSVEDALSLREYLERHPDRYSEILKYTREGRLEWGATNKQPYPSMYDGEALIRQTYFGRKWLQKTLPGGDFRTAFNEDVPGVAIQLPQILAKSGIPYYMISRHQPGFYRWFSPDGSSVVCWTPGQYHEKTMPIANAPTEAARTDTLINYLREFDGYYRQRNIPPVRLALYSFDFSKPVNWDKYMEEWNREVVEGNPRGLPTIGYSTATRVMDEVVARGEATRFDRLQGERPDVWLYIHGPSHQRALKAGREASRLLVAVEKFSVFAAITDGSFARYPQDKLNNAWEEAIYPDHGWGGNHGDITDRLFREKFESARDTARQLLSTALYSIARKIDCRRQCLRAVTVFNHLSWERTEPAAFTLDAEGWPNTHIRIVDASGRDIPFQLTDIPDMGKRDEALAIVFVAEKVPPLGYKTYYVVNDAENSPVTEINPNRIQNPVRVDSNIEWENSFYRIRLGDGGIESLFDKELNREFFATEKFSGGELFTLQSVGNGAGEFTDVQQPTMEGFDQMRNYCQQWQLTETGAVRDVYQTIQPMRETQAVVRMVLYKTIKRIDVEVDLNRFNGENWREFRLAFPLAMRHAKVTYDVPMGTVEVGRDEIAGAAGFSKSDQIYSTPCREVHPREVQDWFSASDGQAGITVSSDVSVFDWKNPILSNSDTTTLQPLLMASRKSCHWLGNYYIQPGNHSFSFSFTTHHGDWKGGYRQAAGSRRPLLTAVVDPRLQSGCLPEEQSFCRIEGKGLVVSAIKKCDDDDSIIMRCYETEGVDSQAKFDFGFPTGGVSHVNMIEEEAVAILSQKSSFSYKIGHHAIETFKIEIK